MVAKLARARNALIIDKRGKARPGLSGMIEH
jgi:hypothetical protein